MGQKQSGFEAAVRRDRDRLLTLLLSHEGLTPADKAELDELVAGLAGTRLPFVEAKLGGGPWVVLYTSGAPQLWRTTYTMGKAVSGRRNLASQDFDPATRSALNRAEYWGGDVWVSAAGTYEPLDDSTSCPKPIQANIESGKLGLWGLELGLPIRGTGTFEVLYLDEELRVFKARDSYAVQVKESALDELTERLG